MAAEEKVLDPANNPTGLQALKEVDEVPSTMPVCMAMTEYYGLSLFLCGFWNPIGSCKRNWNSTEKEEQTFGQGQAPGRSL